MKRIIFITIAFFFQSLNAQKVDSAQGYLKFIDSTHEQVVGQTWNYMEAYTARKNDRAIKGQRKRLENVLKSAIRKVEKTEAYDEQLKMAVIKYLNGNLSIVKNEFLQLLQLEDQKPLSVNEIELLQHVRKSILQLRTDYDLAILNYSNKYDFKILKNNSTLARQMSHTIELYDYFHTIQIQFLKLQRADRILWTDINEKSIVSLKKDAAIVMTNLQELETITNLNSFNEDSTLIDILNDMSNYLKTAVSEKLPAIYVIKEDQLTGNRDQITRKTERYNQALKWSNKNRKYIYELWNSSYPKFLQMHIQSY